MERHRGVPRRQIWLRPGAIGPHGYLEPPRGAIVQKLPRHLWIPPRHFTNGLAVPSSDVAMFISAGPKQTEKVADAWGPQRPRGLAGVGRSETHPFFALAKRPVRQSFGPKNLHGAEAGVIWREGAELARSFSPATGSWPREKPLSRSTPTRIKGQGPLGALARPILATAGGLRRTGDKFREEDLHDRLEKLSSQLMDRWLDPSEDTIVSRAAFRTHFCVLKAEGGSSRKHQGLAVSMNIAPRTRRRRSVMGLPKAVRDRPTGALG